jgi:hypothetical protein
VATAISSGPGPNLRANAGTELSPFLLSCDEARVLLVMESGWGHEWMEVERGGGVGSAKWVCLACRSDVRLEHGLVPRAGLEVVKGGFRVTCDESRIFDVMES